ncbi:MAG: hypothetical protein AB1746_09670 [Candidatus Zixiibacteriota bacterium]
MKSESLPAGNKASTLDFESCQILIEEAQERFSEKYPFTKLVDQIVRYRLDSGNIFNYEVTFH